MVNHVHHQGKHGPTKAIGGKTKIQHVLQKKINDQTGNVPAEDSQNDSQYLCPVTVGTPGKTFTLDFDTGSADLWIWSTELPQSTTNGTKHAVFDPTTSSTFQNLADSSWQIGYGDGSSASGTVGTDTVNIGGLVIQKQAIELANTLSESFTSDSSDGLLGLAWGSINTVQPSPVQTRK